MGLDSYFYRNIKAPTSTAEIKASDWNALFENSNEYFKSLLNKINNFAIRDGYTFNDYILTAIQNFIHQHECNSIDEVMYFRKFHFLNDYFHYTMDNYAKDMVITKEQCIDLRDKAKACLDEIKLIKADNIHDYDDSIEDEIAQKHFPSRDNDTTKNKVLTLYEGMNNILNTTDWDCEYIAYNADW